MTGQAAAAARRPAGQPALDYAALFEQGPSACLVLDPNLVIIAATDAFLRATLSTRADVIGRSAFAAFPSPGGNQPTALQEVIREALQRVQREGVPETLPVHRYDVPRRGSGDGGSATGGSGDGGSAVRYWRTEIMPLPGEPRRPGYLLVRQEDVTRHVPPGRRNHAGDDPALRAIQSQAEDLAQSLRIIGTGDLASSQFAQLLEAAPDGMLLVDAQGIIRMVNGHAGTLFGYPGPELTGRPLEMLIPEPPRGRHPAHRAGYLAAPEARPMGDGYDLAGLRKDGTEFPVTVTLAAFGAASDEKLTIAAVRDASGHERGESAVRQLAAIVEHADDAIFAKSLDGRVLSWNRGAEKLYGYSGAEIIGQPVALMAPADRAGEDARLIGQVARTGQVVRAETVRVSKDGTRPDVALTLSPILGRDGQVTEISTLARDITTQLRAERALHERTRELEASNRELEQFAYVASHDLQEPLRKVSSFCQLLADHYQGQLDEEGEEYIGFAVDGANRMQQLINDLLTLSRVGRTEGKRTSVDCNQVIERVRLDLALAIDEAGAEIVVAGRLPVLCAQQAEQVQLFSNLVANAIKFHGDEPPRIELSAVRDNGDWRFAVSDNGIGIDEEYADRIFGLFQRLHSRSRYPGTGIGLSVCKKIVESNGGRIWLESKPGAGTTFCWTCPAGDGGQG
jgi:PAS domain S-box-containing protein